MAKSVRNADFQRPGLLSYSVIILLFCTVLLQAGRLPLIGLSKGSNNAAACVQPISHFEREYRTWKTWPRTCVGSIFDLIMQLDFEGMCTYAIRERSTNPGEKASAPCVSQAAELASHFSSLQKISYLSCALPQNKRHSAERFA